MSLCPPVPFQSSGNCVTVSEAGAMFRPGEGSISGWPQVWPCVAVLVVVFERGLRNGLLEQCWVVERGCWDEDPRLVWSLWPLRPYLVTMVWSRKADQHNAMPCEVVLRRGAKRGQPNPPFPHAPRNKMNKRPHAADHTATEMAWIPTDRSSLSRSREVCLPGPHAQHMGAGPRPPPPLSPRGRLPPQRLEQCGNAGRACWAASPPTQDAAV